MPNLVDSTCRWTHTSDLTLADNNPMSSNSIDLIIRADLYGILLLDGVYKGETELIAQNTMLGWILSGPTSSPKSSRIPVHVHHGTVFEALDLDLHCFWEVEEIPQKVHLSFEERQCEEHFTATHSRTFDRRYVLRLPFKAGPPVDISHRRAVEPMSGGASVSSRTNKSRSLPRVPRRIRGPRPYGKGP